MKNIFVALLFTIVAKQGTAQIYSYEVEAAMNRIEINCQKCADSGINAAYCAGVEDNSLDSLLNVVYNELKKEMDSVSFGKLRKDQRAWLKKRNANYKSRMSKIDNNDVLDRASVRMEDSNFIEERLVFLSKKLK